MIVVGHKVIGNSLIKKEDIPADITLKPCITWKQLQKYDYKLLENVKKEDFENVKTLTGGNLYSIGACDASIKQITLYIKSLAEILDEKSAIQEEKEKSIKAIQEETAKNVELNKQLDSSSKSIAELRDKVRDLKIQNDKFSAEIENLTQKNQNLQERLIAETNLRQKTETDLATYKNELGLALEDNQEKLAGQESKLTNKFNNEIERIQNILQDKENIIKQNEDKIAELTKINEELGKAGTLPDIPFTYTGKSLIIGFYGQGSYGVSDIVHSITTLLGKQKKVLTVDLDFKAGNLNQYFNSDNYTIDNILRGGSITKEHIIKSFGGDKVVDFIGGVISSDWSPYQIMNLPWQDIFDGEYDYILCDLGSINCYSIQNKVREMIIRNSHKSFYIYKNENRTLPTDTKIISVKNFSQNLGGIPFVSSVLSDNKRLTEEPIIQQKIKEYILNKIIE